MGVIEDALVRGAVRDVNVPTNGEAYTVLHWAAGAGLLNLCDLLVLAGAIVDSTAHNGATPLMWAVSNGYLDVTAFLLQHSANVNAAAGDGWTALHYAARNPNRRIVALLLEAGAMAHAVNEDGFTPFRFAVEENARADTCDQPGLLAVCQLLFAWGK